jgi:tetratricopeptide (TPR) repeat protein
MYDIPELEKKWRKYKRNKIKKPLMIVAIATVTILGVGALVTTYVLNKQTDKKTEQKVEVVAQKETPVAVKKVKQTNQQVNEQAIIIKKIPNSTQATAATANGNQNTNSNIVNAQDNSANALIDISKAEIVQPNVPGDEIRMIGFTKKEKNKVKKKYTDIIIPKQAEIDIEEREKIAELKDKFKISQDPHDSLEIAKYYYERGNYKKAESWAVSTNNLDGDIEDSWLIFAKSRAKQGFRTDAIKVLQAYYDETNSKKAKDLLVKLRFGKTFK